MKRPIGTVDAAAGLRLYSPGADLRRVAASLTAATGALATTGAEQSLTAGCGLTVATADIRRPQVSWDGTKIAFAARSSASEPLAIYEMNADGTACAKHAEIDAHPASQNGLLVHDFDPTYAPPDNGAAAHRVRVDARQPANDSYDYTGPQRTPADPDQAEREPLHVGAGSGAAARARPAAHVPPQHGARSELHDRRARDLDRREARAGFLRSSRSVASTRRRRLSPALRAARLDRLSRGRAGGRARRQELRGDLPRRRPRRTAAERSASSIARSASTSAAPTPRTTRSIPASSTRRSRSRPIRPSSSTRCARRTGRRVPGCTRRRPRCRAQRSS